MKIIRNPTFYISPMADDKGPLKKLCHSTELNEYFQTKYIYIYINRKKLGKSFARFPLFQRQRWLNVPLAKESHYKNERFIHFNPIFIRFNNCIQSPMLVIARSRLIHESRIVKNRKVHTIHMKDLFLFFFKTEN